jgi:hypothetical protein
MRSFIIFTLHQIIRGRKARNVACMGEMRSSYTILVGILKEKKPLRRHRLGSEDNIKSDVREIG